jgi:hypothetical protein
MTILIYVKGYQMGDLAILVKRLTSAWRTHRRKFHFVKT